MPKPLVDRLEGLAPAVAIEQRNPTVSSRSTVGTATEVYDYLRLLWARIRPELLPRLRCAGATGHPAVGGRRHLSPPGPAGCRSAFPLPPVARLTHAAVVENLRALGFVRVVADGAPHHLDELPDRPRPHRAEELLVVVDRLAGRARRGSAGSREAVATAFQEGEGIAVALLRRRPPPLHRLSRLQRLRHARRRRSPRRSSRSTIRAAPAPPATASAPRWSTTSR